MCLNNLIHNNDDYDKHLDNLLLAAELVDQHVLPVVHLRQGHVQLPIHLSDDGDDDGDDDDDVKDNVRPLSAHHLEGALPDPSLQSRSPSMIMVMMVTIMMMMIIMIMMIIEKNLSRPPNLVFLQPMILLFTS